MKKYLAFLLSAVLTLAFVLPANAQATTVTSNVQTVNLTMTVGESLTIGPATPASISFSPTTGTASGNVSVPVTWNLSSGHTTFTLYAYFSTATALTNGSGGTVPTSSVNSTFTGGTTGLCNQAGLGGANTCATVPFTTSSTLSGSGSFTFGAWLSTGILASLPPGSYTGTLNFAAQAI